MGRSRAVTQSAADDDPSQSRSKRKRTASNLDNLETATAGQGTIEGKKALYHCNYCNKDISGKIRIKCAMCSDFDLCVECFSVGAEVNPHKSNHPYRVMEDLSFPLICPDWNADEEILLLEGIEMYGLANWNEVAEHVGTKSKLLCIEHYNTIYMNSPCFPLPDMSHVMGKNREELLAMAREHGDKKKGLPSLGKVTVKEESPFSAQIKNEEQRKEGAAGRSSSSLASEPGSGVSTINANASTGAAKRTSSNGPNDNVIKVEERTFGEKKLRTSVEEGPSMTELSGYNAKRQEFEIEYDNDAEQLLADMEFKETDTDVEREIKLRVLRVYSKRLDERKRRKDFILERNLLYSDPFEKSLTPEEREICQRYRVFMRFHSKEEHEELLKSVIEEHRIVKRIEDLQEARAAGCRTSADAERYIEQKRKREAEENAARKAKDNLQAGPSGKFLQRANHLKGELDNSPRGSLMGPPVFESSSTITGAQAISNPLDDWDVTGLLGADLLSETEKRLCCEMRILPAHYLNMMQKMSVEYLKGSITQKSDAYRLFNVDPSKVDRVYEMLLKKGIVQA